MALSVDLKAVSINVLVRRLQRGDITLAQRDYVWDLGWKSRLVESVMLKLPLPLFYVTAA